MLINFLILYLLFGLSLATEDTMRAIQRATAKLRAAVDAMPTDEELDFQCINRNYFEKFMKNSAEKVESVKDKLEGVEAQMKEVKDKLEAQMNEVKDKLEAKVDNVTDKLEAKVDNVTDKLKAKVESLETKTENSTDKLEAKVDNVTDKLEAQMKEFKDKLEAEMNEVKSEVQTISSKLSAILSRMDQMNKNAETIEGVVQCCPPMIKIPLRLYNHADTGAFRREYWNVEIKVPVGASIGDVGKAVSALMDRSPERTKMERRAGESHDGEKLFYVYGGGKYFFTTVGGERKKEKKEKNWRWEELKEDNDKFIFPRGRRMYLIIYKR